MPGWAGMIQAMLEAIEARRWGLVSFKPGSVAVWLRVVICLARRVSTAVFAEVDLEPPILLAVAYALNGLDGVRDVGEIDKSAALLAQCIHQLDLSVLGEILAKPVLGPRLIQVPNIDVPRCSTAHRQRNGGRKRARVFTPADL